jgi:large subunit ribosomal protein L23
MLFFKKKNKKSGDSDLKNKDERKKEEIKEEKKETNEEIKISKKGKKISKFVLLKPIITEKSSALSSEGKYIFLVDKNANKKLVKENVFYKYNVEPKSVNIIRLKGKTKFYKNIPYKTGGLKKAIITLKKGESIDIQ